ncbi:MAG TPA: glycosyltransferase family 2 protein [Chloroflexota bacterium]|nr:glycosyltransferase family 2 protein [Chloroflexota bacterium]
MIAALSELDFTTLVGAPRVMVGIPALNEARFIGSVVLQAKRFADLVVVVDDGSTDDTALIAEQAGAVVVGHQTNQGKGEALNTLFQAARRYRAGTLVLLDGDGQHHTPEILSLLRPIQTGEADIVIGSRHLNGNRGTPGVRYGGQRLITWLTNRTSGVDVTDSQSGFRAFSRAAIERLTFIGRGFSVESEMQFLASEHGLRLREVAISTVYADPPKRNVFQHGLGVLNGVLQLVERARPLLFFGVPGLLLLLAGLGIGAYVVQIYQRVQSLAVGYALISLLLSVVGLLGLSTALILHAIAGYFADLRHHLDSR